MKREELIRRLNEALDSPDGIEGDLELQRLFVRDQAASDLADEMARIDGALKKWPEPARSEEGWEALATRIEQRLDEKLPPADGDPLEPPRFEDGDGSAEGSSAADAAGAEDGEAAVPLQSVKPVAPRVRDSRSSGEFSLDVLTHKKTDDDGAVAPRAPGEDRFSFSELAVSPPRVGGGIPGFIDVSSAAPEEPKPRRTGLWVGGGLAAAAAVGLALVVGLGTFAGDEEQRVASAPEQAQAAAEVGSGEGWGDPSAAARQVSADPALEEEPPAEEPAEAEETAAEEAETEAAVGSPAEASPRSAARVSGSEAGYRPARRRVARSARPSRPTPRTEPAGPAQTEASMATEREGAGGGGSAGGSTQRAEETALPETPERRDVVEAMNAVKAAVRACAEERHGVVEVDVTVGSSGRVRSAVVTGYFAGTPEGSCVARAVRGARLPRFTRDTFSFTYPFSI